MDITNRLKDFKNYQKNQNKRKVLNAITILQKAKPSEILVFIDKKSEEDTRYYFYKKLNKYKYSAEEFNKKKRELSISLKTIKNILKELYQEKKIIHEKGGYYSLNEFVSNNKFLLFPNEFGESITYSISNFIPNTIENSLEEFINRYGFFVNLVFLRLLYFQNSNPIGNENISFTDNDIDAWLKDAIPLKLMFDLFSDLYFQNKNNIKNINIQKIEGLNKIIESKYPILYKEFNNILKEKKEVRQKSKQNKDDTKSALNKFEKEKRIEKIFKKYKSKQFKLPLVIDNRVYGRVLPKNWNEQISQLAKE